MCSRRAGGLVELGPLFDILDVSFNVSQFQDTTKRDK